MNVPNELIDNQLALQKMGIRFQNSAIMWQLIGFLGLYDFLLVMYDMPLNNIYILIT